MTHGYADYQDVFVEHLRESATGRLEYEYDSGWYPCDVREETVLVRGGLSETIEVVVTRHGPIVEGDPRSVGQRALTTRKTERAVCAAGFICLPSPGTAAHCPTLMLLSWQTHGQTCRERWKASRLTSLQPSPSLVRAKPLGCLAALQCIVGALGGARL